ncbi:hypothetical protein [Anaerolinea sp.]|uniref:argonaute/piwi family protein n=1 Tax=Anaerolinea sp. TaxID=1872519 RepID=UPI002ACD215B|nr:hypothetical protein [Anaerolinea sp.]
MNNKLIWLPEPKLLFNYGQAMEDPRDGLTLFGPLDQGSRYGVRAGVIGTPKGIERYKRWVETINHPLYDKEHGQSRPAFLGFETIFRIPWSPKPAIEVEIDEGDIYRSIHLDDKYLRVYETVNLYASKIINTLHQEEQSVDIWFVIIPDDVYKYYRPLSTVEANLRIPAANRMNVKDARKRVSQPSVFQEWNQQAVPYQYEVNFHNQLKARLLEHKALTQVLQESTIAPFDFLNHRGKPVRGLGDLQASAAWNLTNSIYYKTAGRPWKIQGIRDGVCYIGIVYKQTTNDPNSKNACCAAQMFLDSGDGVVFKGNVGPWYNPKEGDYHLHYEDAKQLISKALEAYMSKNNNQPPSELFIHGKTSFNDVEWQGFNDAVDSRTNLVGVRIQDSNGIKLFRRGDMPVLRGIAYIKSKFDGYLWTRGFVPRLQTYPGMEVPNPLEITICKGFSDIRTVFSDILALTKLNYNACIYGDGVPVTLKFANAVGEILTAGPVPQMVPLPFKHYI